MQSVEKLTRVEMNDKVEKMESAVFAKCTELSKVKLSGALKEMGGSLILRL